MLTCIRCKLTVGVSGKPLTALLEAYNKQESQHWYIINCGAKEATGLCPDCVTAVVKDYVDMLQGKQLPLMGGGL